MSNDEHEKLKAEKEGKVTEAEKKLEAFKAEEKELKEEETDEEGSTKKSKQKEIKEVDRQIKILRKQITHHGEVIDKRKARAASAFSPSRAAKILHPKSRRRRPRNGPT